MIPPGLPIGTRAWYHNDGCEDKFAGRPGTLAAYCGNFVCEFAFDDPALAPERGGAYLVHCRDLFPHNPRDPT